MKGKESLMDDLSPSGIASEGLCVLIGILVFYYCPLNILSWDVFGYYLYLPAFFIHHDIELHHTEWIHRAIDTYKGTETFYQALQMPSGSWVMKYPMGMALLYTPFFLLGHLVAFFLDMPQDGFSLPYQYAVLCGSLAITCTGIFMLRKCLILFFSEWITAGCLIVLVLGTNYLFHTAIHGQGAMSHNYLFTLYVLVIWFSIQWHAKHRLQYALILAMLCGLIVLSRPSEAVCLLIPLLWDMKNFKTRLRLFRKYALHVMSGIVLFLCLGGMQMLYWKLTTTHYLFNSYGGNAGEGLDLDHPHIAEVLFSYRKGWLLYTPLMIFSLLGFLPLYRKNRRIFIIVLSYFIINFWIVSSWSCWWYAESFSQRALIPSYALLAFPLASFLNAVMRQIKVRGFVAGIASLFILFNLFQTWQAINGIIDLSRMTKDYYWSVFARTKVPDGADSLLLINRSFSGKERFASESKYRKKTIEQMDFEHMEQHIHGVVCDTLAHSGHCVFIMDSAHVFSPGVKMPYHTLTRCTHAWIRASVYLYKEKNSRMQKGSLVICFTHNGYNYKYRSVGFEDMDMSDGWNRISMDYLTPEVREVSDELQVYCWNRSGRKIMLDDLRVDVFEPIKTH